MECVGSICSFVFSSFCLFGQVGWVCKLRDMEEVFWYFISFFKLRYGYFGRFLGRQDIGVRFGMGLFQRLFGDGVIVKVFYLILFSLGRFFIFDFFQVIWTTMQKVVGCGDWGFFYNSFLGFYCFEGSVVQLKIGVLGWEIGVSGWVSVYGY